ncbi:DUF5005 domain-containing protein [Mucilaginibacter limnophilus]|uniref:DUF5005 domain-containing protein n=1 Tax=Mucilaginibacter limnophilus TaxID=1932778 RepID=A0A3S2VP72_9SPHI|nr:DUF4185 domain-containing protein [Mucilaginibacter limnophilus]RVU02047.1 DUF5005 domain-containing protein [Mucilaginibacter limnophilus]
MKTSFTLTAVLGLFAFTLQAQDFKASTDPKLQSANFTVEEDADWTALFNRTKGWFGADGIFSIPLDGVDSIGAGRNQTTFFVFSDTLIGEVVDDKPLPGTKMPHNTIGYLTGNKPVFDDIKFYWNKTADGVAKSVFEPKTPNTQKGDYFWLGDGFVNKELNGTTYVFGYRIKNVSNGFGFAEVGNVLIALPKGSKFPFADQRQMDTPFYFELPGGGYGSFGAGILNNTKWAKVPNADGYIYVYGLHGAGKNVMVARVKPKDVEKFTQWRYFDGKGWNTDIKKAATIADRASNEMSVTPLPDGRYAMIFQIDGIGKKVCMRLGSSPYGPFGPIIDLYSTDKFTEKVVTYNAKAHPNLSQPGELLISYNVNFTDFFNQLNASPDIYRPRFIKLKFK